MVDQTSPAVTADIDLPFYLGGSIGLPSSSFSLFPSSGNGPNWGSRLDFRPAAHLEASLSARYKFLGGSITFTLPPVFDFQTQEGTSTHQEIRARYYGESFGIELIYSAYKGYLLDSSDKLSPSTLNGARYLLYPDLENVGAGITAFYVLSPDSFSLAAGLDQSKRQLYSGGSVLLSSSFRYQQIHSPTPFIPAEKQADFSQDGSMNDIAMKTFALGGGYAYTFVYSNLFVSAAVTGDLGPQWVNYNTSNGGLTNSFLGLNFHTRVCLGWNQDQFVAGASVMLDGFTEATQSVEILNLALLTQIFAGYRF